MTAPPGPLFGPDISNNDFGGPDDPDLDAAAPFVALLTPNVAAMVPADSPLACILNMRQWF